MASMNIANEFKGLPMSDLIGGPLQAASDAQLSMARATANFIQEIGLKNNSDEARIVNFKFTRPGQAQVAPDGTSTFSQEEVKLSVPLLAIVNTPSLSIKRVNITFDMEVKETTSENSKVDSKTDFSSDFKIGFFVRSHINIKGSVSTHKENTRTTDKSAKYHVDVLAEDNGMPEGLSRVYDILQSAIAPSAITVKDGTATTAQPQTTAPAAETTAS